jgi:hypothetical protein
LYPRRLEIYDSIQSFIAEVSQLATTNTERLVRMLRETRHADFLFDDDDIVQYIQELHNSS